MATPKASEHDGALNPNSDRSAGHPAAAMSNEASSEPGARIASPEDARRLVRKEVRRLANQASGFVAAVLVGLSWFGISLKGTYDSAKAQGVTAKAKADSADSTAAAARAVAQKAESALALANARLQAADSQQRAQSAALIASLKSDLADAESELERNSEDLRARKAALDQQQRELDAARIKVLQQGENASDQADRVDRRLKDDATARAADSAKFDSLQTNLFAVAPVLVKQNTTVRAGRLPVSIRYERAESRHKRFVNDVSVFGVDSITGIEHCVATQSLLAARSSMRARVNGNWYTIRLEYVLPGWSFTSSSAAFTVTRAPDAAATPSQACRS